MNRRGDLETRLVVVHPVLGVVGTKTIYKFNTRLSALAARCVEHLAGAVDFFPPREHRPRTRRVQIPAGEADLTFGSDSKSVRQSGGQRETQGDEPPTPWANLPGASWGSQKGAI